LNRKTRKPNKTKKKTDRIYDFTRRFPVAYWAREHYFRMLPRATRKHATSDDIDAFVRGTSKHKHPGYDDPAFVEARAAIANAEHLASPAASAARRGSFIRRAFLNLQRRKRR